MKNIIVWLGAINCLISCSEKKPYFSGVTINPDPTELKVATHSFTLFPSAGKENFSGKEAVGLYIAPAPPGDFSPGFFFYRNQKATAVKGPDENFEWKINKPVYLKETPVTVYAYSPYLALPDSLAMQIPIRISAVAERTPFYRYGRVMPGHKRIDCFSPTAVVRMRPVLAEVAFRLKTVGTIQDSYVLKAIQVGNSAGSTLCVQRGLLDIRTGKLTPLPSPPITTRLTLPEKHLSSSLSVVCPLRILPLSRPAEKGEIEVLFTIGPRTYRYNPPAGTLWESGIRYVYELTFNGDSLSLIQVTKSFI